MLRKDPISDESILMNQYPNMDLYLTSPQSNLNAVPSQKSMNQIANMPQPNCNIYLGNKQLENLRPKQCQMRQIVPTQNYNYNYGLVTNRSINTPAPNTEISRLYHVGEYCNPLDKLSLPVKNGQLFGPFSLPNNNQLLTEINFQLTEESLTQIKKRVDLDIVLISRLVKDSGINLIKWPPISISINDNPMVFESTMFNKVPIYLPQFIKSLCVTGKNVVKFEISEMSKFNTAAFEFHIYMVHRPTIVHAKQLATESAFVSDELTYKLLRDNSVQLNRDYVNVSTLCPFTLKKIEIPARLKCCTHVQPFDLVPFLKMQARWMINMCPCCMKSLPFNFNELQQNIVIDKVLASIFEKVPIGCDMVSITVNGTFQSIPNSIVSGVNLYQRGPYAGGNVMISGRHGMLSPHIPDMMNGGNVMMHQSQPLPPNYRPPDTNNQSMNFQMFNAVPNQYRMINTPMNNGTMLDMLPSEDQSSMQPNLKYPHHTPPIYNTNTTGNNNSERPAVKKPAKRKLPRKATPKSEIDTVANIIKTTNNQVSNNNNGAITPPSTRTSSVASTSSPDSLNVPHLNLKRPPSIDLLPNTVLSDCYLSTGDEIGMFSVSSVPQMNNLSFNNNNQMQIHEQQQQQQHQAPHYQQLYQLRLDPKSLSTWPTSEHVIMQQQQQQQQQIQFQQLQQHPDQPFPSQAAHQIQQQQLQPMNHHHHSNHPHLLHQSQHHHNLHQQQIQLQSDQFQLQQQQQQQNHQIIPQHHPPHMHLGPGPQQQQFINMGTPSAMGPSFFPPNSSNTVNGSSSYQSSSSAKQSEVTAVGGPFVGPGSGVVMVDHESLNTNYPSASIKPEPVTTFSVGSSKIDSLPYPNSVAPVLNGHHHLQHQQQHHVQNHPQQPSQKPLLQIYPENNNSIRLPPSSLNATDAMATNINTTIANFNGTSGVPSAVPGGALVTGLSAVVATVPTPAPAAPNLTSFSCSLPSSSSSTSSSSSSSSSTSSMKNFIDFILSSYESVPDIEECPWLEGFNLISLHESSNLSDIEDL